MTDFDPEVGTGSNQLLPFGTGVGANVETPGDWENDILRQQGFQTGIANATQVNTALRQASFIASMIAQFSADFSGNAALDDGDRDTAEQNFIDALRKIFRGVFFITDTGTKNAMVGTTTPVPAAYDDHMLIVVKKMNADNDDAMTANFWNLGAVSLTDNTGAALSAASMKANSYYIMTYSGAGFRVLGGVAQYTSITNLTANSGDMISVTAGSGVVDFRTLRGTHDNTINDLDRWPRGDASTDAAEYVTSLELISWIISKLPASGSIIGIQCITASGTYTKTAGTNKGLVFATGGGGGGSSTKAVGGAAGSTAVAFADLSGVNTVACTIGAGGSANGDGGQTSFGAYAVAGGGAKGVGPTGATGGTATTGLMLIRGGDSDCDGGGSGGASFWGGGGADGYSGGSGVAATVYGAGGGGKSGAGKAGVIFIVEFA